MAETTGKLFIGEYQWLLSHLLQDLVNTQEMYSKQHTVQYMPNSDSSGCLSLSSLSVLTSMTPPCDQIAFLAKMGTKNDRNDMDLKEAEDIKT